MEINKIVLKFLLSIIVLIAKLLKIVITTSNIKYLKNTLKKSLNGMGSTTTVYVFKRSLKGYDKLSSLWFLYVSVNSLSFSRSFKKKFDNWSTLCTIYPQKYFIYH